MTNETGMGRLSRDVLAVDTLAAARGLLGRRLVRMIDGQRLSGLIVETEAYIGEADAACHASRGRTARTEVMYGPPGHAYVYFIYGMYWCLNVVTEREGCPAAVLIRGLEPLEGLEVMRRQRPGRSDLELTNGPGKLCRALGIDRRLNGADLILGDELYLEEGEPLPERSVVASPRIGLKTGEWADTVPWRFHVAGNRYVSHARPAVPRAGARLKTG